MIVKKWKISVANQKKTVLFSFIININKKVRPGRSFNMKILIISILKHLSKLKFLI